MKLFANCHFQERRKDEKRNKKIILGKQSSKQDSRLVKEEKDNDGGSSFQIEDGEHPKIWLRQRWSGDEQEGNENRGKRKKNLWGNNHFYNLF